MDTGAMAVRCFILAGLCLLPVALFAPRGGDLALASGAFGGTLAFIFGVSGIIIARSGRESAQRSTSRPPQPSGQVRHRWSYPAIKRESLALAGWKLEQRAAYRQGLIAGLILAPLLFLAFFFLYGPLPATIAAALCAGFAPLSSRLRLWIAGLPELPPEALFTDQGFAFGEQGIAWLDEDGDPNLVEVELLDEYPPAFLCLTYVSPESEGWAPSRSLVPVPPDQLAEAHDLMAWLETQIGG